MKPDSQCARVLGVLSDGRPHRMEEIHERVGPCRLNSRIAELRTPEKGSHEIECDKSGGVYTYRLVSLSEESVAIPVGAGHSGSPSDRNEEAAGFSLSDNGQLAWDVAA